MGAAAVIGPIIQLVLWILGYIIERSRLTLQQKESFYNFVKDMSKIGLAPVALRQSAESQLEILRAMKQKQALLYSHIEGVLS